MKKLDSDRIKHLNSVANECYRIAKQEYNMDEEDCRYAYLLGYLHDVGFAFNDTKDNSNVVGHDILKFVMGIDLEEIKNQGKSRADQTTFLKILNTADLTIDSRGNHVTINVRLDDIKSRYGKESVEYTEAIKLANKLSMKKEE